MKTIIEQVKKEMVARQALAPKTRNLGIRLTEAQHRLFVEIHERVENVNISDTIIDAMVRYGEAINGN